MQQVFFATANLDKITEAQAIFQSLSSQFQLVTIKDFPQLTHLNVAETGATYTDNAYLKAQTFAQATGLLTLGEDSGLEIEALSGWPGVRSKRFAKGSDQDRNELMLKKMAGVTDRAAKYVCVMCLFDPATNTAEYFRGELSGAIARQPAGSDGFGFDPIFIPKGYEQTIAQLGRSVKNKISHRKKALEKVTGLLIERY